MSAIITAMRKEMGLPDNDESWEPIRRELAEWEENGVDNSEFIAKMKELADSIPLEDWDDLPVDHAINLDHYLYGAPKQVDS